MAVRQVSVFISNQEGRLLKVTEILKNNNINIISASLAEAVDFGLLRLIVDQPDKAKEVLKAADLSAKLSNVIAVKIQDEPGSLHDVLESIDNFNIEYMYALSMPSGAYIIMKVKEIEEVEAILKSAGHEVFEGDFSM